MFPFSPDSSLPSGHKYFYVKMARRLGRLSLNFWLYIKNIIYKIMFFQHLFLKDNEYISLNPFNLCHLWPIKRCVQTVGQQRHPLLFCCKKSKDTADHLFLQPKTQLRAVYFWFFLLRSMLKFAFIISPLLY